jgi:hypothetical protein
MHACSSSIVVGEWLAAENRKPEMADAAVDGSVDPHQCEGKDSPQ